MPRNGTERLPRYHWQRLRRVVLDRDGWRCRVCGRAGILECDHRVPLVRGGTNSLDNLQSLCKSCHIAKTRKENESPEKKKIRDKFKTFVEELT